MKKLLLAVLLVCFVPALAWAQAPSFNYGDTEVEAFKLVAGNWMTMFDVNGNPMPDANARCFSSIQMDSSCNKDWFIPVKMHASIAQWIRWSMTGTRWDWYVRKPGWYAADCISATIASNQNVLVNYEGFGDLVALDTAKAIDDTIEVWYAVWGAGAPPPFTNTAWVRAESLNFEAEWDTVFDSPQLHNGVTFKLWNRIYVSDCNSACEYQNDAFISLYLCCQKPWIDRETGFFLPFAGL